MARRSKVVFCLLLASIYVVVNIYPLRAEALPEVMSGSTTLADNIMTYYALSGSAVANTNWINTLYDSFGSSFGTIEELANQGYLVLNDSGMWEPVQELEQMIEQVPAYSSLGLNEIFNVSSEEVVAGGGLAVASGGSILAGSLGGVASTGVVPVFGGVTAAYWGGISIGTLISHMIDKYIDNMFLSAYIDTPNIQQLAGKRYPGGTVGSYISNGRQSFMFVQKDVILCGYESNPENGQYIFGYTCKSGARKEYRRSDMSGEFLLNDLGNFVSGNGSHKKLFWPNMQNSQSEYNAFLYGVNNGTIQASNKKNESPDLIGEDGNLSASEDEDGNYSVPDMKPQIDPGTQAGKPLTLPDWLAFANAVQNNNNNVNPTPDGNQGLFQDILDLIRTVIPENVPNPNPNPNPDPYSPPVVTPVPDPSYPDPVPDQQITENPQESENPQQTENPIDTGKPWRLPDLRNKFPFCIPWDIAKVFSKFKVNARQAPHISWRFNPPNTPVDYTFNLDLEDFEEVAALLRTLELLGFIVGLAFATRYLIGAN